MTYPKIAKFLKPRDTGRSDPANGAGPANPTCKTIYGLGPEDYGDREEESKELWWESKGDIPNPPWRTDGRIDDNIQDDQVDCGYEYHRVRQTTLTASDGARGAINAAILKIWEQLNADIESVIAENDKALQGLVDEEIAAQKAVVTSSEDVNAATLEKLKLEAAARAAAAVSDTRLHLVVLIQNRTEHPPPRSYSFKKMLCLNVRAVFFFSMTRFIKGLRR